MTTTTTKNVDKKKQTKKDRIFKKDKFVNAGLNKSQIQTTNLLHAFSTIY